jgi:hypothetical protein
VKALLKKLLTADLILLVTGVLSAKGQTEAANPSKESNLGAIICMETAPKKKCPSICIGLCPMPIYTYK